MLLTDHNRNKQCKKGSPYSITECTVLGSQPAAQVTWVTYPAVGCHYFPPGLQLPPQPLRGLLPILLVGEQRHDGRRDCDLNRGPSAPESSTQLPSHPTNNVAEQYWPHSELCSWSRAFTIQCSIYTASATTSSRQHCDFKCADTNNEAERWHFMEKQGSFNCMPVNRPTTRFNVFHINCVTHTHTRLTALFPGLPGWAGTRKVKPVWILLKQETVSGSGISWAICKSAPRSRQTTTPAPHHSVFLQAGCPSCRPTNSVKALKANHINCVNAVKNLLPRQFQRFINSCLETFTFSSSTLSMPQFNLQTLRNWDEDTEI